MLALGLAVAGLPAWAQPANDNFADAEVLTGPSGTVTGSNVDATGEVDEPAHGGVEAGASIWYEWTAPADGLFSVHTIGSDYDTTLAVYSGDDLAALQCLAGNDDLDVTVIGPSGVKFYVRKNQTYKIAVDGYFGATGNVALNWGYSGAGIFQFTQDTYEYSETESGGVISSTVGRSVPGALITVTRLFGTSGRVLIDYTTEDGTAVEDTDFIVPLTNTLVFEDFELSKSFIIPLLHNPDSIETLDFTVQLSNPRLDAADEGINISPPLLNPVLSTAIVNVLNVDAFTLTEPASNAIARFSFEKKVYRTTEGVGTARVYVERRGISTQNSQGVKVNYTINSAPRIANNDILNTFPLQAASDYATPGEDFVHVSGQLSWDRNDYAPKPIDIVINDDEDVEFNEDLLIQLHTPDPNSDTQTTDLSAVDTATLTILFDDLPAGSLDPAHNPDNNSLTSPPQMANPGANGTVYAVRLQNDGKALIAGSFTVVNAVTRNRVARMNTDGSLDTTFNPGTGANGFVTCMDLDSTGRAVIGGGFTSYNGTQRYRIARLNADGSLDTSFNPGLGADGVVWALDVLNDGKVLIAGEFQSADGYTRNYVARLNADGTVDQTFDPGLGPDSMVNAVVGGAGGDVWIGGAFYSVAGNVLPGVARLDSTGAVVPAFAPGSGFDGEVFALALQGNNQLLVGGFFDQFNEIPRRCLARLNPDGSLDTTFDPGTGADDVIYDIQVAADGRIHIAGQFKEYNQTRRVYLARLYANGSVDTSFCDTAYNEFVGLPNPRASDPRNYVLSVALQADGDVLIGGGFARVGGGRLRAATQPDVNDTESLTRAAYRPRANFARVLGGETEGPGQMFFAYDAYSVDENDPEAFITLIRTNGTLGPVSALFTSVARPTGPGAAVIGQDFSCLAFNPTYTVSWPNTQMRSDGIYGPNNNSLGVDNIFINDGRDDVNVPILPNTLVDGNRTFDMTLSVPYQADVFYLGGQNIPTGLALVRDQASTEILDDDFTPGVLGLSRPAYSISENGVSATITVTRTNGTAGTVSVRYETIDGTATQPADYILRRGKLDFLDGQVSKTFTVPIVDDTELEADETIVLRLYEPTGSATLGLSNAVLTIIDNDYENGRVAFTSATFVTNESAVNALITVARTGGSVGTLTVTAFTATGPTNPAVEGVDYFGVTNTLAWANNESGLKSFSVPLVADSLIEPDKTLALRLGTPVVSGTPDANALGSVSNAVLTILNDDLRGSVAFSTDTFRANENSGQALVTVVRQGGSAEAIAVNFSASTFEAVAGVDFVATNGTLNFGPGEVSKSFLVSLLDNPLADGNRRIALALSGATPSAALGSPSAGLLTIVDNETFNEPPGAEDTTLNALLGFNGPVFTLGLQPNGSIVAAGDFTMVNGVARTRIARLKADTSLDQGFGTTAGGANGTIRTLDLQSDGRILVGGNFTTLNGINRARLARLNLDGTSDIGFDPGSGLDGTVFAVAESFVAGTRRVVAAGAFTIADGAPRARIARFLDNGELDDSFQPGLGANGIIYAVAVQPDGRILIGGDFTQYNGATIQRIARLNPDGSLDATFNPGTGCDGVVRTVVVQNDDRILIGGAFTNVNDVSRIRLARLVPDGSLDTGFQPGLGANDTVYTLVVQGDTRILVGGEFTEASGVTRHRLTRLDPDGTVDPTINFGYGVNSFVSAILYQPWDARIVLGGGFTQYDGQPADRLTRIYGGSFTGSGTFEFTQANYAVNENGTNATVTVRRRNGTSGAAGGEVTITFATSNGTAVAGTNYLGVTNTLTFPEGETFQSVLVPILDDILINADRTVNLGLSNPLPAVSGGPGIGNQPTAVLTIVNDDSAISFASPTFTRSEAAIDGKAIIEVVRAGSTVGPASVDFATTTNTTTAVPDVDYTPVSQTVYFLNGEASKTVFIPIFNNGLGDGDRTVGLSLSNALGALLLEPSTAVLTIEDDEVLPGQLSFLTNTFTALESGPNAVLTVIRTNGSAGVVSVQYATTNGTALAPDDYAVTAGVLTFADGETSKNILVPVVDDPQVEFEETFQVRLSNPTGGATLTGPPLATVRLVDNDIGIGFSSASYVAAESDPSVTIAVLRISGTNVVSTVQYTTTNLTAEAGADYVATSGTLTFAIGETLKTFNVNLLADDEVEGDQAFSVLLRNASAGVQLFQPNATVTLLDDDAGLVLSNATYVIGEADTNLLVTVVRTNSTVGIVTVNYTTSDGSALANADYLPVNGLLTFEEGELVKTFLVPVINDTLLEGEETFGITLFNPSAGAKLLTPATAEARIVDNDAGLSFSAAAYSVSEAGVGATITVVRTGVTNSVVSVDYSTANGTATAGQDYVSTSGTLVFATNEVRKTFSVQITDDTPVEMDETVILTLLNVSGQASVVTPSSAELTIIDNDGSLVIGAGAAIFSESGPTNSAIDPGETVTLWFALRNVIGDPTSNLVATLLATNGVTIPSGSHTSTNYGVLLPGGASVSRLFTFTANGTNGSRILATFQLQDGTNVLPNVEFQFALGTASATFSNPAAITIPSLGTATPYPSTIAVSGLEGVIASASLTLSNLHHRSPADIDLLLVGPTGAKTVPLSDVGGTVAITNVTLQLSDAATNSLSTAGPLTSGVFQPRNYLLSDSFPAPAPAGPYPDATLAAFNETNPNGTWSLYAVDDLNLLGGAVAEGWALSLQVIGRIPAATDLSLGGSVTPVVSIRGDNLTYTFNLTNHGPSAATGVMLTNTLPAGGELISASASLGVVVNTNTSGLVTAEIGTLAKDARATLTVVVRTTVAGTAISLASVSGGQSDPNPANNVVSLNSTVNPPSADLAVDVVDQPDPVYVGAELVYSVTVTNLGPSDAPAVNLTNTLPVGVTFVSASPAGYTVQGGQVAFTNLGTVTSGSTLVATVTVRPSVPGTLTNTVSASSGLPDPLKGNNTAAIKTVVLQPGVIYSFGGGALTLTWPAGVTLETTTNLAPPTVWVPVPATSTNNGEYSVSMPTTNAGQFFRLK